MPVTIALNLSIVSDSVLFTDFKSNGFEVSEVKNNTMPYERQSLLKLSG